MTPVEVLDVWDSTNTPEWASRMFIIYKCAVKYMMSFNSCGQDQQARFY